jgi:hypothetical protein
MNPGNANGVPSPSPGLLAASYPGTSPHTAPTLKELNPITRPTSRAPRAGLMQLLQSWLPSSSPTQGSSSDSQPWADRHCPVGAKNPRRLEPPREHPRTKRSSLRRSMFAPALSPVEWVRRSMFSLPLISTLRPSA